MGDAEDVMDMAKKLNMNVLEQKKYKKHLETIRINGTQVKKWKTMNYFWQMIFFGTLFIEAMAVFIGHLAYTGRIDTSYGEMVVEFIKSWFGILFGILLPFSFPLMMWSGVVRGKWEGKLTRATAYCLSFLENIEHREFLEMRERVRTLRTVKKTSRKTVKATPRLQVRSPPQYLAYR